MKTVQIILISLLTLSGVSSSSCTRQDIPLIAPGEVKQALSEGSLFIDVREEEEVQEIAYGLDNVSLIPLSEIADRLGDLSKDRDIIVACRSGKRSAKAASILLNSGFRSVRSLDGGMKAWREAGLPTETEEKTKPPTADNRTRNK